MTWELTHKAQMEHKQRIADEEKRQREQQWEQKRRDLDNAETRRKYLAGLKAEKLEKAKLADIEVDKELAPKKEMLSRQWMADHPGKTSSDFDKSAWPHLRQNLIAESLQRQIEDTKAAMRHASQF